MYITCESDHLNGHFLRCSLFRDKLENIRELCKYLCDDPKIELVSNENPDYFLSKEGGYNSESEIRSQAFKISISNAKEDLVLLIHDDVFYKNDTFLKWAFSKVEDGGHDIFALVSESSKIDFDLADGKFGNNKTIAYASHNLIIKRDLIQRTNGDFKAITLKPGDSFPFTNVKNTTDSNISYEGFAIFSVQLYNMTKRVYIHEFDGYACNNQIQHYGNHNLNLDFINVSGGSSHLNFNLNTESFTEHVMREYNSFVKNTATVPNYSLWEKNIAFSKIIIDKFPYELIEKFELQDLHELLNANVNKNLDFLKLYYPTTSIEKYYTQLDGYL